MFSVVIPIFNHEPYLAECVLSAVRSPLISEVLLLDDGSHDGSARLAGKLAGGALGKVRDITPKNRGNRGANATLNELVEQAAEDWIAVLNSDDIFVPSRFELIRRRMRFQAFDLAFGNLLVMDAEGRQLGGKRAMYDPQLPFPANFNVGGMVRRAEWLPLLGHQNFVATTSNIVFRKELWRKLGGFADLRYVHDWDFVLRAALQGVVAYVPHALSGYRVHARNTIKEDGRKVDAEVTAMFDRLLRDFPSLRDHEAFMQAVAANPYLQRRDRPLLSVVLPAIEGHQVYAQAIQRVLGGVEVTHGDPTGEYVYAPDSVWDALHPLHLQNAVLALETQDLDCVLVSHTLAELPSVGTLGLHNAAIVSAAHFNAAHFNAANFRQPRPSLTSGVLRCQVARLLPGGGKVEDIGGLLPGIRLEAAEIRPDPPPTSLRSPGDPEKPVIFVLPALFAVGGVERLVIDMMRQLGPKFEFVVITVERLNEHQGSLHGSAEGACIGFFDLAELAPPSLFLPMLERLGEVYRPSLVWIPNGSPWQCDHAQGIRSVFAKIPIVDQQVYDTEAGWIARYREPGIRSYDRFIAINRKIEATFIHKYGIAREKIDMIYHSVNLDMLGPMQRSREERANLRLRYGLPEAKQIFGWVGRFTPQKRPLQFLEFVQAAAVSEPNRHFLMIGDGDLSADSDRMIADGAMTNVTRIRFSGRMGELFAIMDGMLSASEYEGLPISMLEALAMGVPIYSTDVGDVGLLLAEYEVGCVSPAAWDLGRYLAGFEEWTLKLSLYRRNAQHAAPEIRRRFGSANVAAEYEKCFRKALEQRIE